MDLPAGGAAHAHPNPVQPLSVPDHPDTMTLPEPAAAGGRLGHREAIAAVNGELDLDTAVASS